MKNTVKHWLQRCGVRISRSAGNRFDAAGEVLEACRGRGFAPRVVIDCGANHGQFFARARPVFPRAVFHLIEPQAACVPSLETLASRDPEEVFVHHTAVAQPGIETVRMLGGGETGSSGSWVAKPSEESADTVEVKATTLDQLLGRRVSSGDRTLLKLDLENHELPALEGASSLLGNVELVLTEVTFFDVNDRGVRLFLELCEFLDSRGFILYDIASLSGRVRDDRLKLGDVVFAKKTSALTRDNAWR